MDADQIAIASSTLLALAVGGCSSEAIDDDAPVACVDELNAIQKTLLGAYVGQKLGPFRSLLLMNDDPANHSTFFADIDVDVACNEKPCATPERVEGTFTAAKKTITLRSKSVSPLVRELRDVDPDAIDLERDANGVLTRALERGCLDDVEWLLEAYGPERFLAFFGDVCERAAELVGRLGLALPAQIRQR